MQRMPGDVQLVICTGSREEGRPRFAAAMDGQRQVSVVRVPKDARRGVEQERAVRVIAVGHGREMLAAIGMKLSVREEELVERFIDATADYVELVGVPCV